eukprot:COSAG01_NODE_525_length_15926_cov_28.158021_22_plen_85_part_00
MARRPAAGSLPCLADTQQPRDTNRQARLLSVQCIAGAPNLSAHPIPSAIAVALAALAASLDDLATGLFYWRKHLDGRRALEIDR